MGKKGKVGKMERTNHSAFILEIHFNIQVMAKGGLKLHIA